MALRAGVSIERMEIFSNGTVSTRVKPKTMMLPNGEVMQLGYRFNPTKIADPEIISKDSKEAFLIGMTNCYYKTEKRIVEAREEREMTVDEKADMWNEIYAERLIEWEETYESSLPPKEIVDETA